MSTQDPAGPAAQRVSASADCTMPRSPAGWQVADTDMGGMKCTLFYPPGCDEPAGGVLAGGGPLPGMKCVLVNNVDESAQHWAELGGRVIKPPTDIPSIGRYCVLEEASGTHISLFHAM